MDVLVTHSLLRRLLSCVAKVRLFVQQEDVKKVFGTAVRSWRSRLAISQEELAERAGLHRTYVSDVERGARNVSLLSIEKLARALEISVASLFTGNWKLNDVLPVRADELLHILYVEDDPRDVELTMTALKRVGMANRIFVVRDGAEALDFLFCAGQYAHHLPDDLPQMILLDLNLPRISGLEVLRRIKQDSRTRSIPVVVLSASDHDGDIAASRKLGAEAYIIKPVNLQSLSGVTPQLSLQWALLKPPALING